MKRTFLILIGLMLAISSYSKQGEKVPATIQKKVASLRPTEYDEHKWTEYIPGNMPLVISVPHGGSLIVEELGLNTCPGHNSHYDFGTIEIAKAIQQEFEEKYKLRPYIVICHLSRKHIDQNRDLETATCGKETMKTAWNNFHGFIDVALKDAVKNFGKAIYIDLHGHPHTKQRVELGYSISKKDLIAVQTKNIPGNLEQKSSLRNFFTNNWNKNIGISDLLIGNNAFGSLLVNNGIPTVPSAQDNAPLNNEAYFAAETVYNTPNYTSVKYPNVIGWQVECSIDQRKSNSHAKLAKAFTSSMMTFIEKNTKIKIKNSKNKL